MRRQRHQSEHQMTHDFGRARTRTQRPPSRSFNQLFTRSPALRASGSATCESCPLALVNTALRNKTNRHATVLKVAAHDPSACRCGSFWSR